MVTVNPTLVPNLVILKKMELTLSVTIAVVMVWLAEEGVG